MSTPNPFQTNVPPIQWATTGIVVPSQAAILSGVQADINAAFGGNLNFANLQTPQGQWSSSLTALISNLYGLFAQLVDGVDPDLNSGFMQSSIGRVYFQNRIAGTPTTSPCTLTGLPGTVIPAGSSSQPQAVDPTTGNLYYNQVSVTIPSGGTATATFACTVNGPTGLASGVLQIYQSVPNWDTISNATGIPGSYTQSAESFEYQREQSVQANAQGTAQAIYGAVANLPGVTACFAYDNRTGSAIEYGQTAYPIPVSGTYVAVVGGTASQIAQTIWAKQGPGSPTVGNQTVTVLDPSYPVESAPAYQVKYNVPNVIPMSCVVTLANSDNLPSNITTLIQNAILNLFQVGQQANSATGQQSIPPVSIASLILAANYFAPVLATAAGVPLTSIQWGVLFVGTGSVTSTSTTLTIASVTSGFMAPGNYVSGNGIPNGTYIIEQLSGTPGGIGTYEMSAAATATESGEAISSATGNLTQFQAGIDQIPTLSAANITVPT